MSEEPLESRLVPCTTADCTHSDAYTMDAEKNRLSDSSDTTAAAGAEVPALGEPALRPSTGPARGKEESSGASQEATLGGESIRRRRSRKRAVPATSKTLAESLHLWIQVLLVVGVIGSVLAIGTVHVKVLLLVAAAAIASGVLAFKAHHLAYGTWPISIPGALILGLTGWTALQALPLPISILRAIAPHNADVWSRSLAAMGEPGPAWASISMDPGATWVEVLKGIAYFCTLTAAMTISKKKGALFGVGLVFISALCAGLFTIAHGLAGLDRVFGIYEPKNHFASWHIGPLLNANHLCGYLNLGAMCGLGILLMRKLTQKWYVIALGVAGLIGIAAASSSRGGVVLIPIGVAAFVVLMKGRSVPGGRQAISSKTLTVLTLAAVAGGGVLALLGLTAGQWNELFQDDISKLNILAWAAPLVRDHFLFGIGRGAFETVYPAYRTTPGHGVWTHPENIAMQWTSEWGVLVAVLAAAAGLWISRPKNLGATRSALAAGGWVGMVILLLQNWVDFSVEIPSVAIAASCVYGSLWGDSERRGLRAEARSYPNMMDVTPVRRMGAALLLGLAGCAAMGLAAKKGLTTAASERVAFYELSKNAPMSREKFRPILKAAMLRHPSESYLPFMGALRAWRARDENPLPYLERTLERRIRYGRAHLLLADILATRGATSQSMIELRHAVLDEPELAQLAVEAATRITSDPDMLLRMVPAEQAGAEVLDCLGAIFAGIDRRASARFDREAIARDTGRHGAHGRLAQALIADLPADASSDRCRGEDARAKCLREVEAHAVAVEKALPSRNSYASRIRAEAMMALDRPPDAWRILSLACPMATDRLECLQAQILVAARLKRKDDIGALTRELGAIGCADSVACSKTYTWIGDFSLQQGNLGAAANAYERAAQEDPSNDAIWIKVGEISVQIGAPVRAIHAWEQVAKRHPGDLALQERIRQEKTKVIGASGLP